MEEAQLRADAAERASKDSIARAESIKTRAFREAEAIRREAKTLREQVEVTRLKEEEKLHKLYPNLRKLVPGENIVNERYVEAFTIDNGVLRVRFRNTDGSSVKPDISISFLDKNANLTEGADFSWLFSSIGPGGTSTDEHPIKPMLGPPVYYKLSFRSVPPSTTVASDARPDPPFSVGDRVMLRNDGNTLLFVATDDSAWHAMLDAEGANSVELMQRLILQGKVMAVKSGTAAVIVQNGFTSKLVLIKEGPKTGREGWIQNEYVMPAQ